MKLVLAFLILAMQAWGVRSVDQYSAVIFNNLDRNITCYVYYDDGNFKKRRVPAHGVSVPFSRYGISGVECF